jgi:hypothetical protein
MEFTVFELDKEHWDDDALMNECVTIAHVVIPYLLNLSIASYSVLSCPFYRSRTSMKLFVLSTAGELYLF